MLNHGPMQEKFGGYWNMGKPPILLHFGSPENYVHKCQLTEFVFGTTAITSVRRGCMSFCFLANSQEQKTLGSIAVT